MSFKRQIPSEIRQLHGYLLMKKQYDDANFIGDMISAMENSKQIGLGDSIKFQRLLLMFRKVLILQGKL